MVQIILFYIFILLSLMNMFHFGFYLVGANYYDISKFRFSSRAKHKRRLNPIVAVLIPAHNEEKAIIRSIESVLRSSYRKVVVIVIDDASTDSTRSLVRRYIKDHPNAKLKLMFKRKNVGKASAMNYALKNGVQSDLVMTLDADSLIQKKTIANAVNYFDDPNVVGVAANVQVLDSYSILGLLQKFEYIIGYRSKKFFSVTNSEFIIGGVASTYRTDVLKKVGFYDSDIITEDIALSLKIANEGNKKFRLVYGVDVIAMTEGVQTFRALLRQRYRWKMGNLQSILKFSSLFGNTSGIYSKMLTLYRIPMAFFGEIILILAPFVFGYIIYYCVLIGNASIFIGSYLTITLYLLLNILPDEHINWAKKLEMSIYAPIMYFIMYLMDLVQLVAIVRCMINYPKVFRRVKMLSTWKSPERQGQRFDLG